MRVEVVQTNLNRTIPDNNAGGITQESVSYTHLRAHETVLELVCRLLLEKKKHMI